MVKNGRRRADKVKTTGAMLGGWERSRSTTFHQLCPTWVARAGAEKTDLRGARRAEETDLRGARQGREDRPAGRAPGQRGS
jgi:hypothetical protein